MFWIFGFKHAWRYLDRSVLVIISIALATGFVTYSTGLSRGYTQQDFAPYRSLIGGEISVYSINLNLASQGEDTIWRYQDLTDVQSTDLAWMMPELSGEGYVSPSLPPSSFNAEDILALREMHSVDLVYPRYQMPAITCGSTGMWQTVLRGRNLAYDAVRESSLKDYVSQGRWFRETDQGELVVVVSRSSNAPPGEHFAGTGDLLRILVPRIIQKNGDVRYDYSDPIAVELRVIGVLQMEARDISYQTLHSWVEVTPFSADFQVSSQLVSDEIHLPYDTWEAIWHVAGGEAYLPQQLALTVKDLSHLEDVVLELRRVFPEYSFYSVPQLVSDLHTGISSEQPDPILLDTFTAIQLTRLRQPEQKVLAQDFRMPMAAMLFCNASLVLATSLLIMISERKKEVGILKSVGATRLQVIQMVVAEALLVSLIGASGGFLFFRIPAALTQMTNSVSIGLLAVSVAGDYLLIIGIACLFSLVFALLPALKMANLSVREILQGDSV
ncbi:MAG: ABC transporter permease [Symbiobacteriaceae bacterium]|nr:ABC transporter permease [Symbiobacteriaceae bacterium]